VAWQLAMPWNARNTHVKDDGWLLCGAKASGLENYAGRCNSAARWGHWPPGSNQFGSAINPRRVAAHPITPNRWCGARRHFWICKCISC